MLNQTGTRPTLASCCSTTSTRPSCQPAHKTDPLSAILKRCSKSAASKWTTARSTAGLLAYALMIEKRLRRFQRPRCGSVRVEETYVKIRGKWRYLYRAIDKHGTRLTSCPPRSRSRQALLAQDAEGRAIVVTRYDCHGRCQHFSVVDQDVSQSRRLYPDNALPAGFLAQHGQIEMNGMSDDPVADEGR